MKGVWNVMCVAIFMLMFEFDFGISCHSHSVHRINNFLLQSGDRSERE